MKNNAIKDMSIYEASDFWDEHDFDEFGDFEEVTEIQFLLKKEKKRTIMSGFLLLMKEELYMSNNLK